MYRGYLEIGSKEIANSARLAAYLDAFAPGAGFRPGIDIENLAFAIGDEPYTSPTADDAPWVDSSQPASEDFWGCHILQIDGVEDSTAQATTTENITSGGSVGRSRDASREIRVKVLLVAATDLAMAAGWTWLKGALAPDTCGMHGGACGGADLCFFVAKPVIEDDDPDPNATVAPYERRLHDVVAIQGAQVLRDLELNCPGVAREATFIFSAATPYLFSNTEDLGLGALPTAFYSDTSVKNISPNPSSEGGANGYIGTDPAGGDYLLTNPTTTTAFGTKVARIAFFGVPPVGAGGGAGLRIPIDPNSRYSFGFGHVKPSITNRLQLQIDWFDGVSDTPISTDTSSTVKVVTGGTIDSTFKVENLAPPAGAAVALAKVVSVSGASFANWGPSAYIELDGMMVNGGPTLLPYFDGDTADTNQYDYDWLGVPELSPSSRSPHVTPQSEYLVDPNLPVVPDPPRAPFIPDPAVTNQPDNWLRYYVAIPGADISGWAATVPTIKLKSNNADVRFVRFRFTQNPFGYAPDAVDPLDYCAEFILSYLPSQTELTVDGAVQRAWAVVAGGPAQAAEQLLYATDGSPMTWPEMTCNIDYVMTIDVPSGATIDNLDIDLALTRRE